MLSRGTTPGMESSTVTLRPVLVASVQDTVAPVPQRESFGRGHTIPLSLGLAAAGLMAIVFSRFRRG